MRHRRQVHSRGTGIRLLLMMAAAGQRRVHTQGRVHSIIAMQYHDIDIRFGWGCSFFSGVFLWPVPDSLRPPRAVCVFTPRVP